MISNTDNGATCDPIPWEITPADLDQLRRGGREVMLIDCREPWEHHQARIEGGELVPMAEIPDFAEDLEDVGDRPIIIYCHHGIRSLVAAAQLRQAGFKTAQSLAGGIDRWTKQVDPAIPSY